MKKAITILTAIVMCVSMSAKMMVYSANDIEFYLKIVSASAGTISNDGATITFASAAEAKGAKLVVQEFIKADASNPSIQQIGSTFSVSDKAITLGHGVSYSVPIGEMKEYTLNGNTISTDLFVSCFAYAGKRKKYGSGTGEATWGHSTDFQWAYDGVDQLSIIWASSFDDPNYDNSTETAHFQGDRSDAFPFTQFEATIGDVETGIYTIDIIDTWEHAELYTQNGTFINVDGKNKVLITNHNGIQIHVGGSVPVDTDKVTTQATPTGGGLVEVSKDNSTWSSSLTANEGEKVYFRFTVNEGYDFVNYSVEETVSGNPVTVKGNSFTMPAVGVTVKATFAESSPIAPVNNNTVTVQNDGHGTASASPSSNIIPGTLVTLKATPNMGYKFKEWQVVSGGDDFNLDTSSATTSFFMPNHSVTVMAVFEGGPNLCGENVTWSISGDVLTISGTGDMYDYAKPGDRPWNTFNNDIHSIVIESGVTSIGKFAFQIFSKLTAIIIPASVTLIGDDAFDSCWGLATVTFDGTPELEYIGGSAFHNCKSLTTITIPAGVTYMGYNTFIGCDKLKTVYVLPTTPPQIGTLVFSECPSLESIYVPASALSDYQKANYWKDYASIIKPASEEGPAIASVTTEAGETTEYSSVEKAVSALQDGDVLTLLDEWNSTVDESAGISGDLEFNGKMDDLNVTLDLNGHTMDFAEGGNIVVMNKANLTIKDSGTGGKVSGRKRSVAFVDPQSYMTIEGGTFENLYEENASTQYKSAIYNSGALTVNGGTINGKTCGIFNEGRLWLTGIPTFSCTGADIWLAEDKVICFDEDIILSAAPTTKIKVGITNGAPYIFAEGFDGKVKVGENVLYPEDVFTSSQYGDLAVGYSYFNGTYEAGIAGLTEITFPAGKSTYFDDRALALYEANDNLKFYTVTDVNEDIVELTEFEGKLFGQNTPLIVSNETDEEITAKFIEAFDGPMANNYANMALDDLGDKFGYYGFEGTNEAIDKIDVLNGPTYYNFYGSGFVRMNSYGPIAAHRCWLWSGMPQEEPVEPTGPRSLTISWPDGTTTGDDLFSAKSIVDMVNAIANPTNDVLDMNGDGVFNIADIIMVVNGLTE
ncbi:MAG: leucine-rich repeat domain-containing protein [Prevotella sp.]|nr:leucine-rich repeat domain-containing protein [Prevotella sp.]